MPSRHLRPIVLRLAWFLRGQAGMMLVERLLGLLSASITMAVVLSTLSIGHLPDVGAAGLVCALVLAAVAGAAAAAPVKPDRAGPSGEDRRP